MALSHRQRDLAALLSLEARSRREYLDVIHGAPRVPLVDEVHDGSTDDERRHDQERAQPPPAPWARSLPCIGGESRPGSRSLTGPGLADSSAAQRRFPSRSVPGVVIESLDVPPELCFRQVPASTPGADDLGWSDLPRAGAVSVWRVALGINGSGARWANSNDSSQAGSGSARPPAAPRSSAVLPQLRRSITVRSRAQSPAAAAAAASAAPGPPRGLDRRVHRRRPPGTGQDSRPGLLRSIGPEVVSAASDNDPTNVGTAAGIGLLAGVSSRWLVVPLGAALAGLLFVGRYDHVVAVLRYLLLGFARSGQRPSWPVRTGPRCSGPAWSRRWHCAAIRWPAAWPCSAPL